MTVEKSVLAQLMAVIEDRRANPPEKSYTTTLFKAQCGEHKPGEFAHGE